MVLMKIRVVLYADAVRNISWDEVTVFILSLLINLSQCSLNNIQLILESAEERCLYIVLLVLYEFIYIPLTLQDANIHRI